VRASFAPSATNDPAKLRRSHVITLGREVTWPRTEAARTPYAANTTNVASMKTPLSANIRTAEWGSPGLTNWGRKAKKKIVSFGVRMLISTPRTMTRPAERGAVFCSTVTMPSERAKAARTLARRPRERPAAGQCDACTEVQPPTPDGHLQPVRRLRTRPLQGR
jgi:hypothetical protein